MTLGRSRFSGRSLSCFFRYNKKKRTGLKDYQRLFTKQEFQAKTIHRIAQSLVSKYNITIQQAYAYISAVGKYSLINKNGNVSGGNNTYYYKVFSSIYDEYKNYLSDNDRKYLIKHLENSDYVKSIRELINSPYRRGLLLANEMYAYLDAYYKRSMTLSNAFLHFEQVIKIPVLAVKLWSKPAFWFLMGLFVFNVDEVIAKEKKQKVKWYEYKEKLPEILIKTESGILDWEAIELGKGINVSWYDMRPYMSEYEKAAWYVYDNIVSELAREFVAAGVSHLFQKYILTNGLRKLASTILTIASFIPSVVGAGARLASIVSAIANYVEKSLIVWLAGQIGIEWQFEKWAAMQETDILSNSRDFWAEYKPISDILNNDEIEEFFNLWDKLLTRKFLYLDAYEQYRLSYLLNQLKIYGEKYNIDKLLNVFFKSIELRINYEKLFNDIRIEFDISNYIRDSINRTIVPDAKNIWDFLDNPDNWNDIYNFITQEEFCNKIKALYSDTGHNPNTISCYLNDATYEEYKSVTSDNNYDYIDIGQGVSLIYISCSPNDNELCIDYGFNCTSVTTAFWDKVYIKKSKNFPAEQIYNYCKNSYMVGFLDYESLDTGTYEGSITENDIIYSYSLNVERKKEIQEKGACENLEIDNLTVTGYVNLAVPYTPEVVLLPIYIKNLYDKYYYTLLTATKSLKCVGYKYSKRLVRYVPVYKGSSLENFLFKENGYAYIYIRKGSIDGIGTRFQCGNNCSISSGRTALTPKDDIIELFSSLNSLTIREKLNKSLNTRNGSIFAKGSECDIDCAGLIVHKIKGLTTDIYFNITLGNAYEAKIKYLPPLDLRQTGKRKKIICFPYNPLSR